MENCSLKFPIRTAYLKHVHATHKGRQSSINTDILDVPLSSNNIESLRTSISIDKAMSEELNDHGYENGRDSSDKMDVVERNDFENIFPDVKIKEEIIEDF